MGLAHSVFLSWDEADQDKALAFMAEKARVCVCGTRKEEWESDRFAYVADSEVCPGCEIIEQERENIPEGTQGAKIFLVKNRPDLETSDGLED